MQSFLDFSINSKLNVTTMDGIIFFLWFSNDTQKIQPKLHLNPLKKKKNTGTCMCVMCVADYVLWHAAPSTLCCSFLLICPK